MSKDLTKKTTEELYNEIFQNYKDQITILKEMIEDRDKFISMLEKQLENSDMFISKLLSNSQEDEGEKSSRGIFDSETTSTTFPFTTNE